jgi:cytochrome c oxidase subunit 4
MSTHNEPHAAASAEHAGHAGHDTSHDPGLFLRTLIALLILTVITVVAAGFNFGSANVVIALTIATIKASLVALFFMHLAHDKPVNAIVACAGFIFLGLFLLFTFLDVGSRVPLLPQNMPAMEQPTPTPTTLNPLLTPPPQPEATAPKAEGEAEHK